MIIKNILHHEYRCYAAVNIFRNNNGGENIHLSIQLLCTALIFQGLIHLIDNSSEEIFRSDVTVINDVEIEFFHVI